MKKRMKYVGLLGFILTFVLGLNITPAAAAENISMKSIPASSLSADNGEESEIEPYAVSRKINNMRIQFTKKAPLLYYYSDSLGYKGYLTRSVTYKEGDYYLGIYSGLVYCEGTCPAPINIPLDEK